MPVSKPPRHARRFPQHSRDLKESSMDDYAEHKANAERGSRTHFDTLDEQARQKADIAGRSKARQLASARPSRRGKIGLALAGAAALGTVSPPGQRMQRKAKIGGLAYRSSPEFRTLPRSERKRVINQMSDEYEGRAQSVGKGLVSIPARHVSQGGAAGIKRLKGAAEEAAQSTWKTKIGQSGGRMGKAYKPTTPYEGALRLRRTLMQSKESAQRAKVQPFLNGMRGDVPARGPMNEYDFGAGVKAHHSIMRQRGVSKSLPEATAVRRVTPRTQSGRYVSHENDLVYIQPRSFGSRRPTRDSKLQVWHKKGKSAVGKASVTEASLPTLADTAAYTGARHGRRDNVLKSVTGAAEGEFKRVAGDLYGRMSRKEITHAQYKTGHDNARNAFHIQTGQATPAPHIKVLPKMPKRHVTLPTGPRSDRKLAAPPSL